MKKIYFISLFCIFFVISKGQKEYTNNWVFSDSIKLNFSTSNPSATKVDGFSCLEGSSSISDNLGNILFYFDGSTVWNANNEVMLNGIGLFGGYSTTQSSIIIKIKGFESIYYLFTLTDGINDPINDKKNNLYYSIIDMSINSGLGKVTSKNNFVYEVGSEKLAAVVHCNKKDTWILSMNANKGFQSGGKPSFLSFLISSDGIINPPVKTILEDTVSVFNLRQLKVSLNGQNVTWDGGNYNAKFDISNGRISEIVNNKLFETDDLFDYYGVEFSPNGNFIYNSKGHQINTLDGSIFKLPVLNSFGPLQLGSDGLIYMLTGSFLSTIESPDKYGLGANFVQDKVSLLGKSYSSLPNFVVDYLDTDSISFDYNGTCSTDTFQFNYTGLEDFDSLRWDFPNGTSIIGDSVKAIFNLTGDLNVSLTLFKPGVEVSISQCISVRGKQEMTLKDTTYCVGSNLEIFAPYPHYGDYSWSNGSVNSYILVNDVGYYTLEVNNGCESNMAEFYVKEIGCFNIDFFVPNIFSPNGDGTNDNLITTISPDIQNISMYNFSIYNRWGINVFETEDKFYFWDGKLNGSLVSEGVYFWVSSFTINSERQLLKNGFFQLYK